MSMISLKIKRKICESSKTEWGNNNHVRESSILSGFFK